MDIPQIRIRKDKKKAIEIINEAFQYWLDNTNGKEKEITDKKDFVVKMIKGIQ